MTGASDEGEARLYLTLAGGFQHDRVVVRVGGDVPRFEGDVTTSPLTEQAHELPPISTGPGDVEVVVELPSRRVSATKLLRLAPGQQRWITASVEESGDLRLDDFDRPPFFG